MIISQNTSCAGNRIKSWVAAMRLAEVVQDDDVKVYWPDWLHCPPIPGTTRRPQNGFVRFSEIFKNKCEIDSRPNTEKQYCYYPDANVHTYGRCKLLIFSEDNLPENFIKKPFSQYQKIDHQYNRIPENIKENYVRQFSKIKFQDEILEKVESFNNFPEGTVSVQIRTYCNSKSRYPNFNLKRYLSKMEEYDSSRRFFVCSDSEPIIEEIKDLYGDRIITFNHSVPIDCDSKAALIDAMTEVLLLSKNNEMILTEESTFSEIAWWLGGAKAKVKKVGAKICE